MFRIIVFIFCFLLSKSVVSGTPIELTKASHNDMINKNWSRLGDYYDDTSLAEFRKGFDFLFALPDKGMQNKIIINFFGNGKSVETIKRMDNATFFENIFSGLMKSAAVFGQMQFDSLQVLGSVKEGDNQEHVLTRNIVTIGKVEIKQMEIVSFKKINGQWKMVLSDRVKGLSSQIKSSLGLQ